MGQGVLSEGTQVKTGDKIVAMCLAISCGGCIAVLIESDKPDTGQLVCKTKEGYTSCNPDMGGFAWFDPDDESRHRCETKGAKMGDRCLVGRDEGVVK